MNQKKILLVDDDSGLLKLLSLRLRAADYIVETADSGYQALIKLPAFQPQLIITDLRMEGMGGLALFEAVNEKYPALPVIILTAHGSIPDAVAATRKGVFSYLTKPFESQQLLQDIEAAFGQGYKYNEDDIKRDQLSWRKGIISQSLVMEGLLSKAHRVAQSDVSVLIQSESGTGKELLARAVHNSSPRHAQPFIPINCAAIPESMLESELFGHRKGAFTGADRNHEGLFEAANHGTLFLDEIGDMPMEFQSKLLRVLQDGEVRPVGETQAIPVDVRIISATHGDLDEAIKVNKFREDLYYRINVVSLELPALRNRREDISLLANHFLKQATEKNEDKQTLFFSPDAMELLMTAPWPGNIRQLQNVVEQAAVLTLTPIISRSLIEKALRGKFEKLTSFSEAQSEFERNYLIKILQITQGNVTKSARLAQRNRTEFYKLLQRNHLEPGMFRTKQ